MHESFHDSGRKISTIDAGCTVIRIGTSEEIQATGLRRNRNLGQKPNTDQKNFKLPAIALVFRHTPKSEAGPRGFRVGSGQKVEIQCMRTVKPRMLLRVQGYSADFAESLAGTFPFDCISE
jgi:hypothetical protein